MKVTSGDLSQNSGGEERQGTVSTRLSTALSRLKRIRNAVGRRPALVASLIVTGLLLGGRQLGLLEPLELSVFDRLMQLRPALPPDQRLLLVEVTDADINALPDYPMYDAVMHQLLTKLEQYQPAAIGVDIFRDRPQEPGHAELSALLKNSDRIISVCAMSNAENPTGISPPPSVPDSRVGFADLAVDRPNGIIRRALLYVGPTAASSCTTQASFSFQIALHYLAKKGIVPTWTPQNHLKLGQVVFKPLSPTDGGYQNGDTGGYQVLLNYRSGNALAQKVTLSDVLSNRIDKSLVKDRIVLIGVTAPSEKDTFYTPYSSAGRRIQQMPGVVVHGQIVSQVLSSVLDGRSLFWFWPDWAEVLWIWSWSLTGGVLVRVNRRHPGKLVLAENMALGLLLGISVVLFLFSGWIPVVAPTLGLVAACSGVLGYSAYEAKKELDYVKHKAKEQEQNIALLQGLLKEKTDNPGTTEPDAPLTGATEMPPDEPATAAWNPEGYQGNGATPSELRPSASIHLLAGRYKINRVLGSGGFGLTYVAQDTQLPGAPQCVVKQLRPARRDERFMQVARRLFDTEAEILHKLGNHPQIPRLLAHFEESKEFYLVEEYVEGHTLNEELPVDKRLPEAQVLEILKGVLEILSFIHEHSVIHRDIKPGNIMRRTLDGEFVLIDFGAVKQIQPQEQTDQANPTVAIGTRGYAPPESYAGHPSFSSDIYSLGMIGIQALTGIAPYQLPISEKTGDVTWRHLANISEEFAQILEKMVRYHFAVRYQSAAEVMKELESLKV